MCVFVDLDIVVGIACNHVVLMMLLLMMLLLMMFVIIVAIDKDDN